MKIQIKSKVQGSVLLVSLLTATVIGIALGSYLSLTANQHQSVFRSMTWNEGIPIAEAGIEEALTQVHYYGITNFSANHWTWGLDGCYHKNRSIGTNGAYYDVAIRLVDPPVITSTAYVPAPMTRSSAFGMILGVTTSGGSTNACIKRRIQVKTAGGSSHGAAVISQGPIFLSGNNVTIDSFISSDSRYSSNGMYVAALARDHGDVVTNAKDGLTSNNKPIYALDVGDADIKGHVTTGPGGTAHVTTGGSVGDNAWVNAGMSGIKSGYQANDANIELQTVNEPFAGNGFTPVSGTNNNTRYDYYLAESGNYKLGTLTGKVLVTGNATLWVTDDVAIKSGDFIKIAAGASLKRYVSAPSAVVSGQGIVNETGYAKNFQYYGLPTNTSIDYKGNSAFTGTIYAPKADVKLGGGGTTDYDFVGSIVAKAVTLNGHFHIHYDEAIQPVTPNGYVVAAWNEVDPTTL